MNPIRVLLLAVAIVLGSSGHTPELATPEPPRLQPAPGPILVPVTLEGMMPLTEDEVYLLLERANWPADEVSTAAEVAYYESRWDPSAVGSMGERGIFQVRPEYHGSVPSDPLGQAKQALGIWSEWGWEPWSCRP